MQTAKPRHRQNPGGEVPPTSWDTKVTFIGIIVPAPENKPVAKRSSHQIHLQKTLGLIRQKENHAARNFLLILLLSPGPIVTCD
jgi:hypothetical protein